MEHQRDKLRFNKLMQQSHFVRVFSATFRDFNTVNLQLIPGNGLITNQHHYGI
jgi:hypothetical protein